MECSICVHTSKTKKIVCYEGKPICVDCLAMLKYPIDFERMRKEVEDILHNLKKDGGKYHCILAFSGGKDSVLALKLLKERFKLNPLCVMVDNKYMAKEAIENALNVAKYYGADLMILNRDYTDLFEDVIKRGESPCRRCSRLILREVWRIAKMLGLKYVVTGHELPFGHSAVRDMKEGIKMIRLLAPYKFKEEEKYEMLKDLPWKKPDLGGYTTNCLVLGVALERFYDKYGFSFEIDRVATLVRLGLLSKDKAKEALERPKVPKEVYEELRRRGLNI